MIGIPAPDAPLATSEGFVMGSSEATESSLATLAQHRLTMAVLSDLSLVIDSKNIARCASCTRTLGPGCHANHLYHLQLKILVSLSSTPSLALIRGHCEVCLLCMEKEGQC
ncbi:hypothetical protein PsorP6_009497 [Peronosclerospora sorghi]|uniref:Uncharacterized protein n=1 Tax=Peronosclerospora sorghi TaxID=230839 RepID=A0ACC0W0I5_9STRA|nr:hypothetical protein PsorP6_009497 [Peronosclerospora sorghi]